MTSSPRDTNNQISCYPTKEKTHAVHTLPGDNREKPEAEAQRRERCSFPMAAAILSKAVSNKRRCPMNGQLLWLKCPGACRVSFHGVSLVIHTANTHQGPTNRPGGILSWQGGRKTPQTKPMIPVRFGITRLLEIATEASSQKSSCICGVAKDRGRDACFHSHRTLYLYNILLILHIIHS